MRSLHLFTLIILLGLFKNFKLANIRQQRYIRILERRHNIRLRITNISIKLFKGLKLERVDLRIKTLDIKIDQCYVNLNFVRLFKDGLISSTKFKICGISIDRTKSSNHNQPVKKNEDKQVENWDKRLFSYFKKLCHYFFKHQIEIDLFDFNINLIQHLFYFEKLTLSNGKIAFNLNLQKRGQISAKYHAEGNIDQRDQKLKFKIIRSNDGLNHLKVLFDEFEFVLDVKQFSKEIHANIEIGFSNLQIFDERLSSEHLKIDNIYVYIDLELDSEHFVIKEESGGSIGEIPFAFSLLHEYSRNDILKFSFSVEASQELLDSFLTFHNIQLEKIKMEGKLVLDFQLLFNITDPLQSYFNFSLIDNTLRIIDIGSFDLSFLNENLKSIVANPLSIDNLLPRKLLFEVLTDQVAENFLTVIIATEDESFYSHHGVNLDSIGYALVSNISKRKFSRGASTITMQLTRNLFLNSQKNVVRKIEEIIISLIIENHCNISKKRILEVYINIIEFGPGIYGIEQASNYYFAKSPKHLSFTESIVLSYIVPRPKHFHDALLIKTPQLLENLPHYFRQISGYLLNKKLMSKEAFNMLDKRVIFANKLGTIELQLNDNNKAYTFPI